MPNWCSTTYEIRGKADDLLKIESAIKAAERENLSMREQYNRREAELKAQGLDNAAVMDRLRSEGTVWRTADISLLHLLRTLGLPPDEAPEYNCRGSIIDHSISDGCLTLSCETAWCETYGFRHTLQELVPGLEVLYTAVETGCGVYCTNDPSVAGQVDVELGGIPGTADDLQECFENEEKALKAISDFAGKPFTTVTEVREWVDAQGDDAYLCWGVFEFYE